MVPLLPVAVLLLGGGSWYAVSKRKKDMGMTAARKLVFDQLINTPQEPALLREMAAVFSKHGLTAQADLLEKRAKLRELPPETKEAHKDVFRDAMADKDPRAVEAVAAAFEKQGATGNAAALRAYAKSLRVAQAAAPKAPGPVAQAAPSPPASGAGAPGAAPEGKAP